MSIRKSDLKTKVAAGAVLVALSGFVPQPFMQQAHADTATINAVGTFVDGITLAGVTDLDFGSIVAAASTGDVQVQPDGNTVVNSAAVAGTPAAGQFQLTVAVTGPDVIISLTDGIGNVAGPIPGTITLSEIVLDANGLNGGAPITITATGAPTTVGVAALATAIDVGGTIAWTAGRPIGAFTQTIGLSVTF